MHDPSVRFLFLTIFFIAGCDDGRITADAEWKERFSADRSKAAQEIVRSRALDGRSGQGVESLLGRPDKRGQSDQYVFVGNASFLVHYSIDGSVAYALTQYVKESNSDIKFDATLWDKGSPIERMKMARSLNTPDRKRGLLAGGNQTDVRTRLGNPDHQITTLYYMLDSNPDGLNLYVELDYDKVVRTQILKGS